MERVVSAWFIFGTIFSFSLQGKTAVNGIMQSVKCESRVQEAGWRGRPFLSPLGNRRERERDNMRFNTI